MAFEPLTVVKLLKDVPLHVTKYNTFSKKLFTNAAAQLAYFNGKPALAADNLTYQRENMFVRFPYAYDVCIQYNYMMYNNAVFGNKWFFAFVTRVEYENEACSRVYFQVDPFQTWLFDMNFGTCYVEREHVTDDVPGNYILDEPVALGEYIFNESSAHMFTSWRIVVGLVPDGVDIFYSGEIVGNIYTGIAFQVFSTAEEVATFLEGLGTKIDAVVCMYMIPTEFTQGDLLRPDPPMGLSFKAPANTSLGSYVPKNKKLLTYPYTGLVLQNNEGAGVTLRYEFFGDTNPTFYYTSGSMMYCKPVCWPNAYARQGKGLENSVSLGPFPQCAWNRNNFEVWQAFQSVRNAYTKDRFFVNAAANALGSAVGGLTSGAQMGAAIGGGDQVTTGAGALTGGYASVGSSVISSALDYYNIQSGINEEREIHQMMPNNASGSVGNGNTNIAMDNYGFIVKKMSITPENAKVIDDFFSMYGYKVNRLKVPNTTTRPNWNFVKTKMCYLTGNIPQQYITQIQEMMNRGMTFWHTQDVGNYGLAN